MPFCPKCGAEIASHLDECPECWYRPEQTKILKVNDDGGFLWGLLGFCVPVAGLVLYLIWKDEKPLTAKAAGIGALMYVGAIILLYIFYMVILVLLLAS